MPLDRRQFILSSSAAAGLVAFPGFLTAGIDAASRPLNILVLGGTGFLGPHTVEYALARGHKITLFNRGRTNKDLFPELPKIVGDRDPDKGKGLTGLQGKQWDAVIDTSGYVPRLVEASSRLLAPNVKQYLFVSTICQYDNWAEGGTNGTENRPPATLEDPKTEDVRQHYCALKAYCEKAAEKSMPGRVTQIRPGLIVGPRDKTDRFTYWPVRFNRGGKILLPGKPDDVTQFIDVRDLAKFMIHTLEKNLTGSFNLVQPTMPFGKLVESCKKVAAPKSEYTWVPADFLSQNDVQPWRDIHMWADKESAGAGALTWSSQKAIDAGLTFTPIDKTVEDTLAWFQSLPAKRQEKLRAGMSLEKESKVLNAWSLEKNKMA
ncbi:NAD-dependent epimerase/dehydratase family protein [Aliikangiella sp. G2MR2-5]|uniref:NAD-dependent epimerase/dehydratase family protein n=1 Tax=Aliikangiella sp. G2MR2-5 TaxID=2788943 RepID=UPI0018AA9630|nr:NAD-dependent epimerase/dehydratase family protein [Aliikangiella sp. G2MR2-5]